MLTRASGRKMDTTSLARRGGLLAGAAFFAIAPFSASSAPTTPDNAATAVGEIVVTAQKRAENIIDVPISMTAVTGRTLKDAGISSFHDLASIAPSFTSREWGDARTSIMTMRGVASQEANPGEQSSIGVFIDGVFLSRTGMGSSQDLLDVERVEVLRGPQGTLFGMNTAAGLINVITRQPDLTHFDGYGELVYGSYNDFEARATLSGPIVPDVLGFSLAGYGITHDGYTYDPVIRTHVDDEKKYGLRGKLRYVGTNFDATLSADYHQETSACCSAIFDKVLPGANIFGVPIAPLAPQGYPYSRQTVQDTVNENPNEGGGVTAELNWRVGGLTVTSLSAYRFWNASPVSDIDSLPLRILDNFTIHQKHEQFSQELRVSSPSGEKLEYVAGLFYFYHRSTDYENLALGPDAPQFFILPGTDGATVITSRVGDSSYAAFAHVDYHWTDQLTTSAGVRYTQEPQNAQFTQTSNNFAYPTLGSTQQSRNDGQATWMADVSYKWSGDVTTYASVARGFKPGGFDLTRLQSLDQFQFGPETNTNYEIGLKSSLFEHRLSFDAAAFYTQYQNFQAQAFDGVNIITTNAGAFVSKGVEAQAAFRPIAGLTLAAAGSYVDARYTRFPNGQCLPNVAGACDLAGKRLSLAPQVTFNASAEYRRPLSTRWDGYARVDYAYTGSIYFSQSLDPNSYQPGYGVVNARIGIESADRLALEVFASNLTDTHYMNIIYPSPLATGLYVGYVGAPRVVGVRLSKGF
jgi:iron complex outermembrane receptor protein